MGIESICPACDTPAEGEAGEPLICAACGAWWVAGDDPALAREGSHELEIQNAPGDAVRGPFDRLFLRERLYAGIYTGEEHVRPPGGRFRQLRTIPDFAAVLALKERGIPKPVVTRRAAPPAAGAGASAATNAPAAPAPAVEVLGTQVEVPDKSRVTTIVILTVGIGVFLVLVAFAASSMMM